jgi:hypothetical protein
VGRTKRSLESPTLFISNALEFSRRARVGNSLAYTPI